MGCCSPQEHQQMKQGGVALLLAHAKFIGVQDFGAVGRLVLANCRRCQSTLAVPAPEVTPEDVRG